MRKRSRLLAALLCAAIAFAAGCGKGEVPKEEAGAEEKTEEKEEVKEEDEYLSWIQEAFEQFDEEKLRGFVSESVETKEDGSSEQFRTVKTVDTEKQIVMFRHEFSDPEWEDYTEYYTKEGDNEYWYTNSYDNIPLKVLSAEENSLTYSEAAKNYNPYESDEDVEISDIKVTKEGEEELEGILVLKFKVEYKQRDKFDEMETRESLLEEEELTEEDVAMLEGFSDKLDAYVALRNKWIKENASETEKTDIVYISSEEHKLVQIESKGEFEKETEEDKALQNEYWNGISMLHFAKDRLDEGAGRDEAVRMMQEAFAGDTAVVEDEPETVSSVYTDRYLTGEQCEPVGELPADAKEVTREQYLNGEY